MLDVGRSSHSARRISLDLDVASDGQVLSTIVRLLADGGRLNTWPSSAVAVLGKAMWPEHGNQQERDKARRLRRHLFVDLEPPVFPATDLVPGRWSDRVRADLPDLVPFAIGLNLLRDDQF